MPPSPRPASPTAAGVARRRRRSPPPPRGIGLAVAVAVAVGLAVALAVAVALALAVAVAVAIAIAIAMYAVLARSGAHTTPTRARVYSPTERACVRLILLGRAIHITAASAGAAREPRPSRRSCLWRWAAFAPYLGQHSLRAAERRFGVTRISRAHVTATPKDQQPEVARALDHARQPAQGRRGRHPR